MQKNVAFFKRTEKKGTFRREKNTVPNPVFYYFPKLCIICFIVTCINLIWRGNSFIVQVGCGSTSFPEGKYFTTLYACNYGPNGNINRGAMYKQGE